jgi:opacity protein-like surface antigen
MLRVLMVLWSVIPMMVPAAYSQPKEPVVPPMQEYAGIDSECRAALEKLCEGIEPGSGRLRKCYDENEGKLTPSCRQQVQDRKAEAAAIMAAPMAAAPGKGEPIIEYKRVRPSETYVAAFGGYTFDGKLKDVESTGLLPGINLGDRNLADSAVYGGKLGHFFGDRMDWLGVEMEAFNTTPHVEQQGPLPGSHFRVTTLAFNVIGRLKFGCEKKTERTETRTEGERRYETRYEREFCRLQPYAGVGLGVFFANLSNNGNSVSDNAVPGLNVLGGIRYYFTERIALFGEYKYNWAALNLTDGAVGGFKGDYQVNHVVGGLSFHF